MLLNTKRYFLGVFALVCTFIMGCDHHHHSKHVTAPDIQISQLDRTAFSGQTVSLHAFKNSNDIDLQWKQISGTKVTLVSGQTANPQFVAPAVTSNETLSFKLVGTNSKGSVDSSKISVRIFPENHLIVEAQNNQRSVSSGELVSLHATGSGASSESWSWTQVSPDTPIISLNRANTADPDFTAPNVDKNTTFRFQVEFSDSVSGDIVTDTLDINVNKAVSGTYSTPLTLVGANNTPAQKLTLLSPPDAIVFENSTASIAMTVTGGTPPYDYQWIQESGTSATLSDDTTSLLSITTPDVATDETLSFTLTVTDDDGDSLSANARVRVAVRPATIPTPTPIADIVIPRATLTTNANTPLTIKTDVIGPTFTQTGGSVGVVTAPTTTNGITSVTFTPPTLKANSEQAQITIEGSNTNGDTVTEILPIIVMQSPGSEAVTAPPLVSSSVPQAFAPLAAHPCGSTQFNEGQQDVVIGVCATGGDGTYTYEWTYFAPIGKPPISLSDNTISHPSLDVPVIETPTGQPLAYKVLVKSGNQETTSIVFLKIINVASTITLDPITPITVGSGHLATLNMPQPSGGVPPYDWAITQTAGTNVALSNTGSDSSKQFTAPTLTSDTADETLTFEYTITDSFLNSVKTTQDVVVKAPRTMAAELNGPNAANQGATIRLNTNVNGGTAPYTYAYTVTGASLTIADSSNPEVTLPTIVSGGDELELTISLSVTDDNGVIADAGSITLHVSPPTQTPVPAVTATGEQAALQKISETLAQSGGSADDIADALASTFEVALANVPEDQLTATIISPSSRKLLDTCGVSTDKVESERCVDAYGGDCASEFSGLFDDPSAACFIVPVCLKTAHACNGVTPEMKAQMDSALQTIEQWFTDNPGCQQYLNTNNCI